MGYEKMLKIKFVGLQKVYKFAIKHFLMGIIFFLINFSPERKAYIPRSAKRAARKARDKNMRVKRANFLE